MNSASEVELAVRQMEVAIEEYKGGRIRGTEFIVWVLQSIQQVAMVESAEMDCLSIEPTTQKPLVGPDHARGVL